MISANLEVIWVMSVVTILTVICFWPGSAIGQSPSDALLDSYRRYHELFAQGRYAEAMPFAEEALNLGQQQYGPDHLSTATLLNDLGEVYRALGRYSEAEPLHQRALTIRMNSLGSHHPQVAYSLGNLGTLYYEQGGHEEAEPLFIVALQIVEKALLYKSARTTSQSLDSISAPDTAGLTTAR